MATAVIPGWKASIGMVAACIPASALAEDLPFSYTVPSFCSIVIVENGILAPSPNMRTMRSRLADGGMPARLSVHASSAGFTLSVSPPSGFASEPAENVTPQTISAVFRSIGASVFSETATPQTLAPGISTVRVVLTAQKTAGNLFPAGNYSAIVPVLCE